MTATADAKKRIYLKAIKPGDRFDVQVSGEGTILLRRLEPVKEHRPPKLLRFEKRGKYTVGVLDRPIDEKALKAALADFP